MLAEQACPFARPPKGMPMPSVQGLSGAPYGAWKEHRAQHQHMCVAEMGMGRVQLDWVLGGNAFLRSAGSASNR